MRFSAKYLPTGGSDAGTGGHIVYFDRGTLFAVPFDPSVLELRGPTVPVLDNLAALPSFSNTGSVLYLMGAPATQTWPVDWLRSSGETETLLETPAGLQVPARFARWPIACTEQGQGREHEQSSGGLRLGRMTRRCC